MVKRTRLNVTLYLLYTIALCTYLVCPDLLRAVGETCDGIRAGFIGSTHCLQYLFIYICVFVV